MNFLPAQYVNLDQRLRHEGLCIAPIRSTPKMNAEAADVMRKRKETMASDWFVVGNKTKAGIRWTAMLEAWWSAKRETETKTESTQL